jgi:hypothetical protein
MSANHTVAAIEIGSCVVANFVADIIGDHFRTADLNTLSAELNGSGLTFQAVSCVIVELRDIALLVTVSVSDSACLTEFHASEADLLKAGFAFNTVSVIKVEVSGVAFRVACAVTDVFRHAHLHTFRTELLIAEFTN